jgi:hypothetical protein
MRDAHFIPLTVKREDIELQNSSAQQVVKSVFEIRRMRFFLRVEHMGCTFHTTHSQASRHRALETELTAVFFVA